MSSEKPRGERRPERRRTASIARSVSWGFAWRKFLRWLLVDLLLVLLFALLFVWFATQQLTPSALDGITFKLFNVPIVSPAHSVFTGTGAQVSSWAFVVHGGDGHEYRFALAPYLQLLAIPGILLLVIQWADLLNIFSDTRRVRRKLQPLNDLALMADSIGVSGIADPMASDADKMATLEQAIARASVDSPMVSTGDQDLRSIEVALNNLLRQMQEAKLQQMRFVSDASHELRTPIAVIQGYVNMLDRWGASDEEVLQESIDALKAESKHMQELVEQLLFLARGDSGRNTLQFEQVNMADLVLQVLDESSMIDERHDYACSLSPADAEDERFVFTGDVAMTKQALRIIVSNAQRYSPEGSTITLSATADAKSVSCAVQDEGIGMSDEEVTHAFERFFRAEGARSVSSEGSGLGLSIAKWIVDAHGGSVEVLSRQGVGTRFSITLPKQPAGH